MAKCKFGQKRHLVQVSTKIKILTFLLSLGTQRHIKVVSTANSRFRQF
jgi:hypothetical protein